VIEDSRSCQNPGRGLVTNKQNRQSCGYDQDDLALIIWACRHGEPPHAHNLSEVQVPDGSNANQATSYTCPLWPEECFCSRFVKVKLAMCALPVLAISGWKSRHPTGPGILHDIFHTTLWPLCCFPFHSTRPGAPKPLCGCTWDPKRRSSRF
jgi:hypothetical protein